jgi:hypothetical protein
VTVQQISILMCIPMPAALCDLVLVEFHPKLRSFVRLCAWSMLSLGSMPPLAHFPAYIVCLASNLFKKYFHNWKNSFLWILRTCTCPWFFLEKTIVIPQAAHQALGTCFDVGFLKVTPDFQSRLMWVVQNNSKLTIY